MSALLSSPLEPLQANSPCLTVGDNEGEGCGAAANSSVGTLLRDQIADEGFDYFQVQGALAHPRLENA